LQSLFFPKYSHPYLNDLQLLITMQAVKKSICSSVDLLGTCEITLKMSMGNTRSWPVLFKMANNFGYITGKGFAVKAS